MRARDLQQTLSRLAESRSRSNPGFNALLSDYKGYHVVLLVSGGLVEVLVVSFCIFAWTRAKRAPRVETGKGTSERRTYLAFALFTTLIGLAFALGLVANLTTVLNPWPGFESVVASLPNPRPGTQTARLFDATSKWIASGSAHTPTVIHAAVQHRLSWQRPRTIVSAILAVAFLLISVAVWKRLIERSKACITRKRFRDRAMTLIGAGAVVATLLFTVLAVSNVRGTIKPLSITILQAGQDK